MMSVLVDGDRVKLFSFWERTDYKMKKRWKCVFLPCLTDLVLEDNKDRPIL